MRSRFIWTKEIMYNNYTIQQKIDLICFPKYFMFLIFILKYQLHMYIYEFT